MEKILILTHTESDGALPRVALEVLSGATALAEDLGGAEVTVGLVGGEVQPAADSVSGCGAAEFLGVSGDEFAASRYATDNRVKG